MRYNVFKEMILHGLGTGGRFLYHWPDPEDLFSHVRTNARGFGAGGQKVEGQEIKALNPS